MAVSAAVAIGTAAVGAYTANEQENAAYEANQANLKAQQEAQAAQLQAQQEAQRFAEEQAAAELAQQQAAMEAQRTQFEQQMALQQEQYTQQQEQYRAQNELATQQLEAQKASTAAALAAAQRQQAEAERQFNKLNQKQPDVGTLMEANKRQGEVGGSGTMLTGPLGVDPQQLTLGRSTLLGG